MGAQLQLGGAVVQEMLVAVLGRWGGVFFLDFRSVCALPSLFLPVMLMKVWPAMPGMESRPKFRNRISAPVRLDGHLCG